MDHSIICQRTSLAHRLKSHFCRLRTKMHVAGVRADVSGHGTKLIRGLGKRCLLS
jgi:hypothetical protein